MKENFNKLFQQHIKTINPPQGLEASIVHQIHTLERSAARTRFAILGSLAFASFVGIIQSLSYLLQSFSQSGFYHYFSLIFSENSLATYWKELTFSLVESLPLLGLIMFLSITALFLWSTARALRDARSAFIPA